jgi:hypothetical protein
MPRGNTRREAGVPLCRPTPTSILSPPAPVDFEGATMKTSRAMGRCLLMALGLASVACSHAATTQIQNPLSSGSIADNRIEFGDAQSEAQFELPRGTLSSYASLTSLDAKDVCFDVTLATLEQRRDLASLKGWRVFLRGEPEFEDMTPSVRDEKQITESMAQGTVERQSTQTQQICDDAGNCYNKNITTTYREPATLKVLGGGGTVCFANKGHIKKTTEQITLHLDDPNPGLSNNTGEANFFAALTNRVAFRWKFN